MKLQFKEDPKEWRKQVWLTLLALVIVSGLLCWRRVLPFALWCFVAGLSGLVALAALIQPNWFRGYYRFAMRLGFWLSQILGRLMLTLIFFLFVTPLGWTLRLAGKNALQLKRPRSDQSCWRDSKDYTPLDSAF